MKWNCEIAFFTGADNEGPWFLPDILVNVRRPGDDSALGVIRDVLPVSVLLSLQSIDTLYSPINIHCKWQLLKNADFGIFWVVVTFKGLVIFYLSNGAA